MADLPTSVRVQFEDAAPERPHNDKLSPVCELALRVLIEARDQNEGLTTAQLRQRCGLGKSTATNALAELKSRGLMRVIGKTPFLGANRKPWALYAATTKARMP